MLRAPQRITLTAVVPPLWQVYAARPAGYRAPVFDVRIDSARMSLSICISTVWSPAGHWPPTARGQAALRRPRAGLAYLGRYTHRVALSNDRLLDHDDGRVRVRWKDYADHDRVKVLTLDVDEFLRRFLLHVVPRGFMRIRHFGLLANRTRRGALTRCRDLLGQPPPEPTRLESVAVLLHRLIGIDLSRCPVCGEGRMQITALVVHAAPAPDTS